MDLTAGVTVRFSGLCIDAAGRLGDYPLWQTAVRSAVLVDRPGPVRLRDVAARTWPPAVGPSPGRSCARR